MTQIKGYQIIKKLGEGGMAVVYLAKEESLEREIALKVLTIQVSDETFKKSFIAEARLFAKLEHQHIIKIYRVSAENNQLYMEMELLREGTLKERLEKTTLSVSAALSVVKQIASALSYAHKKGYIHRDIKPANILFRSEDEVVLADFGIAKSEGIDSDLTIAGHSGFGTPNYMAPEQAMGEKVDGRADMYSLGVMLYEMLTQEKPFKAGNTVAIIRKHLTAEIPHLPAEYAYFQPVLNKVLAKDRDERYVDVLAFSQALLFAHEKHLNTNNPTEDETRLYSTRDETIPRSMANETKPYSMGEQTYSGAENSTHGNVTRPWNIPCKESSVLLVICFIDIIDSTKLSQEYGDIVYAEDVRQNFERIIKENMQDRNEGALIKFLGDGVMMIYSDPVYAIENSLRIQQATKAFLAQTRTPEFMLRIGLNIGGVTLENDTHLDVQGIHVNKAQRIEGKCAAGQVAISRSVYDIAYPRLKHHTNLFWKDIGEKKLKGIPDKEKIYLVSPDKIDSGTKHIVLYGIISVLAIGFVLGGYGVYNTYVKPQQKIAEDKQDEVKPQQKIAGDKQDEVKPQQKIAEDKQDEVKPQQKIAEDKQDEVKPQQKIAEDKQEELETALKKQKEQALSKLSAIEITSTKEIAKTAASELSEMPKITISIKNKAYIHCLYQAPKSSKEEAMMRLYPLPMAFINQLPTLKKYQTYKERNAVTIPIGEGVSGVAKIHCFTTTKMIKDQYFSLFNSTELPLLKNNISLDAVRESIEQFTDGIYKEETFEQIFQ